MNATSTSLVLGAVDRKVDEEVGHKSFYRIEGVRKGMNDYSHSSTDSLIINSLLKIKKLHSVIQILILVALKIQCIILL